MRTSILSGGLPATGRSAWWRRALFQVHLWTGLGIGIYVVVVSLSGSAIVFRRELNKALCPRIIMVNPSGVRMTDAQLATTAQRAFQRSPRPGMQNFRIEVHGSRAAGAAVEVWYVSDRGRIERLFDPYTGRELGDTVACEPALVWRLVALHADLLGGDTGRAINGVGGVLLVVMCATGAIIWWPGAKRWRRSLTLRWNVGGRRFTRDLHGVSGFWLFALILLWAVSGVYLAFPNVFYAAGNFLLGGDDSDFSIYLKLNVFFDWLTRLHFGRAFGFWVKVLWVILGLVPCALLVTGALMWWHRVVRPASAAR
jgi:uncharacterized iron-regulated membrane protein